jgi:hypothetical protein
MATNRQLKKLEFVLVHKHIHQSVEEVQKDKNKHQEEYRIHQKNNLLIYRIPQLSTTRNPVVFDRQRITRKVKKLLARNLRPRLTNNEAPGTTNGDNANEICGFEFYWWKVEIMDQAQVKAEWSRNQFHIRSLTHRVTAQRSRH